LDWDVEVLGAAGQVGAVGKATLVHCAATWFLVRQLSILLVCLPSTGDPLRSSGCGTLINRAVASPKDNIWEIPPDRVGVLFCVCCDLVCDSWKTRLRSSYTPHLLNSAHAYVFHLCNHVALSTRRASQLGNLTCRVSKLRDNC
jgi:hypothetical protein